ncbi:MAG: YihY/virulence factor BrkB family protein [Bacteroidota bacterium]
MTLRQRINSIRQFLEVDLWKVKISTLPKWTAIWYQQLRVTIISITEFTKYRVSETASALTYFSILSIVPVLAMAFGIAQGFGLEKYLTAQLNNLFGESQGEVMEQALTWAQNMLASANGGVITGISFVFLVYAVLRLLNNIELAFNGIWHTRSRSWQRKLADYLAIIIVGPIFIILSGSATALVGTQFNQLARNFELLAYFKPLLFFLRYILIWISLTLLYLIFPNTKVKIIPAIVAGILAGTAYELVQLGWVQAQVFLSKYNAIYGSFAALPLFLIWLQLSWTIVLFGAEYAYATQNANLWQHDLKSMKLSNRHRWEVTFLVLRHIIKNFEQGDEALTVSDLSSKVQIPYRFVRDVCQDLTDAGVLNQVNTEDDTEAFQPAMDIAKLDMHTVMTKVNERGFDSLKADDDEVFKRIESVMMELESSIKSAPANRLIKQL